MFTDDYQTTKDQMKHEVIRDCSEGFYRDNGSTRCIPNCYTWTQFSKSHLLFHNSTIIIAAVSGLIAAVVAAILSCFGHKEL